MTTPVQAMQASTDYIIIGAGSSGCVLAAELSANSANRVLLIESGPSDDSWLIGMPRGIGKLLVPGGSHVWTYDIDKGGDNGAETWLKGHVVGGSSSINGMVYSRGFASDYDRWVSEHGCAGWGWQDMLEHFKAHEDHALGAGPERGAGGPLKVTPHPVGDSGQDARDLCEAFLSAAGQAGIPRVPDTNTAPAGGVGYQPRNIAGGRRQSAAQVFLRPCLSRPNLTLITDTRVLRILFEGKHATGVEVLAGGASREIHCTREVILCAGAIESPKLMQLSGIGPAESLATLGIPVVHDAPQVGRNLREHYYVQAKFRVNRGSLNSEFQGRRLVWNMLRYFLGRRGPMGNAAQEMIGYVKTREGLARPDCQIGAGLYSLQNTAQGPVLDRAPGLTIGGYHMHPRSQGSVLLTSADPFAAPAITANYLRDEEDSAATIALLRYIRNIAAQPALADFIEEEFEPGATVQSDQDILAACQRLGGTAYHVSGTCRMGADGDAVVDPDTRVRGVSGLRVVDTSIFPELISGNTNAPAMAAGRKAAGIILAQQTP